MAIYRRKLGINKEILTIVLLTIALSGCFDNLPPKIVSSSPNHELPAGTNTTIITVSTQEQATCRYSNISNQRYEDMSGQMDSEDKLHSSTVDGLENDNTYTYYIRCEDKVGNVNNEDYLLTFSVLAAATQATPWAYTGIPYTDWAYNPFTIQPDRPLSWPTSAKEGVYYIEPAHPNASDDLTSGELVGEFGRFGYPERPRATIPTNGWIGDVYSPGTVIWLKGGYYTNANFYSAWSPQLQGSESEPVWIFGDPEDKPVFSGPRLQLYNSHYAFLDNLQWIGENTANNVLSLTRDREGPTHHITLRNLHFENLDFVGGGGAIVGISASSSTNAEVYDIVAYRNTFKNNGGGFDWSAVDNDHHGYKVNGMLNGNGVKRVWIIENRAIKGNEADSIDGRFKSLSGNLVQVGDQNNSSGNNHHIYVAGNYQEFARQALGWTKKSRDVIFSENYCTDTYALAGGSGQCYGHQYSLGDHNWWINNVATRSSTGWMHTAGDDMEGPLFVIGNLFYNNRNGEANDNWRLCSGVTLFNQHGTHYFVNNVFDNSCHGIWAQTNRSSSDDELHIYNNIFSNITATVDTTSKAISLNDTRGINVYMENNLFEQFNHSVSTQTFEYATIDELNALEWAANNIEGNPGFVDQLSENYRLTPNSIAIDQGSLSFYSGATSVYQQFIERYRNDPDYPGDPADYFKHDAFGQARVSGGQIDIGPSEWNRE